MHSATLSDNSGHGIAGTDPNAPRSLITVSTIEQNSVGGLSFAAGVEVRDSLVKVIKDPVRGQF